MASDIEKILEAMERGSEIHFNDLFKVCRHFFGQPRNVGSSHYTFKTPWPGNPRINIQNRGGKAKPYQITQVLAAIAKLTDMQAKQAAAPKQEVMADRKPPKKK